MACRGKVAHELMLRGETSDWVVGADNCRSSAATQFLAVFPARWTVLSAEDIAKCDEIAAKNLTPDSAHGTKSLRSSPLRGGKSREALNQPFMPPA